MPAEMGKKLFDNCLDFRYLKHINKKSENIYIHTHTHEERVYSNVFEIYIYKYMQSCLEIPNQQQLQIKQ